MNTKFTNSALLLDCVQMANDYFGCNIDYPKLPYSLDHERVMCAVNTSTNTIDVNDILQAEYPQSVVRIAIPQAVAHLIVATLYPSEKVYGTKWASVCAVLGTTSDL